MTAVSVSKGRPISRKPEAARRAGRSLDLAVREEAVHQNSADVCRSTSDRDRAADQPAAAAQHGDGVLFAAAFGGSRASLAVRQECHKATDCHGSSLTPFSAKRPAT